MISPRIHRNITLHRYFFPVTPGPIVSLPSGRSEAKTNMHQCCKQSSDLELSRNDTPGRLYWRTVCVFVCVLQKSKQHNVVCSAAVYSHIWPKHKVHFSNQCCIPSPSPTLCFVLSTPTVEMSTSIPPCFTRSSPSRGQLLGIARTATLALSYPASPEHCKGPAVLSELGPELTWAEWQFLLFSTLSLHEHRGRFTTYLNRSMQHRLPPPFFSF